MCVWGLLPRKVQKVRLFYLLTEKDGAQLYFLNKKYFEDMKSCCSFARKALRELCASETES